MAFAPDVAVTYCTLCRRPLTAPLPHLPSSWGSGAEFVYPQSTSPWTEPRCAVASINSSFIAMRQPCWKNLVHKACGQGTKGAPTATFQVERSSKLAAYPKLAGLGAPHSGKGYVENVGLTDSMAAGEWALVNGSTVLYALRPSDAVEGLEGEMPTLSTLIHVRLRRSSADRDQPLTPWALWSLRAHT